jgi:hypothetical protein
MACSCVGSIRGSFVDEPDVGDGVVPPPLELPFEEPQALRATSRRPARAVAAVRWECRAVQRGVVIEILFDVVFSRWCTVIGR